MSPSALVENRKVLLGIASTLWLGGVLYGFHRALTYSASPGPPAEAEQHWPASAPFSPHPQRHTLVLAAHPHCPCTRATLGELDRLLARCRGGLEVFVLFYSDPALGDGWERTDLWTHAAMMPGVHVRADPLGRTAALFGARVSGQVLLYSPGGELRFAGGITAARGHEGDNPGAAAVASIVAGEIPATSSTPVYGCPLSEHEEHEEGDTGTRP